MRSLESDKKIKIRILEKARKRKKEKDQSKSGVLFCDIVKKEPPEIMKPPIVAQSSMKKSILKILISLLIINLNWAGLSAVITTLASLNDIENSSGNFVAGNLDFYLDSPSDFTPVAIEVGETATREITVINLGNIPQYIVTANEFSGDLCNYLNLEANVDEGDIEYSGSLVGFNFGPIVFADPETWVFTLNVSPEAPEGISGETCQFKFVFEGSQTENSLPFGTGFNDEEEISNNIATEVCYDVDLLTIGYWKNHREVYIPYLPQYLGGYLSDEIIDTVQKVNDIFDADNSVMRNKLKKQLLAMKFDIVHFGVGEYIPPGATSTLNQIVIEADNLLRASPPPSDPILEAMKNRLDNLLNNLPEFEYCTVPGVKVLVPNGGEHWFVGRSYNLEWESQNLYCPNNLSFVDIWYSKDSGKTFANVASSTENDGLYNWRIPLFIGDYFLPSGNARIKIVAKCADTLITAGWDMSDEDFCPPIDYDLLTPEELELLRNMGLLPESLIDSEEAEVIPEESGLEPLSGETDTTTTATTSTEGIATSTDEITTSTEEIVTSTEEITTSTEGTIPDETPSGDGEPASNPVDGNEEGVVPVEEPTPAEDGENPSDVSEPEGTDGGSDAQTGEEQPAAVPNEDSQLGGDGGENNSDAGLDNGSVSTDEGSTESSSDIPESSDIPGTGDISGGSGDVTEGVSE